MGNRHVRTTPTLDWKFLEELYGSDGGIRAANEAVRGEFGMTEQELTDLVDKYLGGYRHEDCNSWEEGGQTHQGTGDETA